MICNAGDRLNVSLLLTALLMAGAASANAANLNGSDDPTLALTAPLKGASPAPAGSAAPNPDPRNFEGVWWLQGYEYMLGPQPGVAPPLKPEYMRILERRIRAKNRGTPEADASTQCLPHGMPRLMLMHEPFEILQRDKAVYFIYQLNRLPRRAYFGEKLPEGVDPLYLGFSVARWEGNALLIDSSGFRDGTLLDDSGLPHTEALKLTERYELGKDGKMLRVRFTIDDPQTFTHPWSADAQYRSRPGLEIREEVCADKLKPKKPKAQN